MRMAPAEHPPTYGECSPSHLPSALMCEQGEGMRIFLS